jgi:hypothetical protein
LFFIQSARAQTLSYPEYDMEGDTIWHTFPQPDSTYVHHELILKFLDGTLNEDSLCYDCEGIVSPRTRGKGGIHPLDDETTVYFAECKETLMTQHFTLDIITDPLVRSILAANGVSYLRRMTAANPCADTLSLSRFGDTIHMDHYNWMIAEFNNDTSVNPTLVALFFTRAAHDSTIQVAEPNYYLQAAGPRTPSDPEWMSGRQKSLEMMGMDDAWNHIGDNAIQEAENLDVAVVDEGVDYWRCDLGGNGIPNGKVIGGWCYSKNPPDFPIPCMQSVYVVSLHGTQVASIIGALTNNITCGPIVGLTNGMAGIAGGFGPAGSPNLGSGVKIVAYSVPDEAGEGQPWVAANVAGAILEAGASSVYSSYGNGVDVINLSGGYTNNSPNYSIAVRNAMSDSWENGTTFVAAEDDVPGEADNVYPSDHEPASEVIAVTSSDQTKSRENTVSWGFHTDLTAPGGELPSYGDPAKEIADALQFDGDDGPTASSGNPDSFNYFGECSAAAPQVTGVAALERAWLRANNVAFAREDVEGMLKASALDLGGPSDPWPSPPRTDPDGTQYLPGFDDHAGWGFIQADQLFEMIDPTGDDSYQLEHIEVPSSSISAPDWSDPSVKSFSDVIVYTATLSTDNIPSSNAYDVKMREVTGTASYGGLGINTEIPVYTWGNSGVGSNFGNRGVANLMPNWQEPWCEVTNGQLGNQGVILNTGKTNVGVPGIRHEFSTDVTAHTFQYQLVPHGATSPVTFLPANTSTTVLPGLGFTVFGSRTTSSVRSVGNSTPFNLWPSIASASFHIGMQNIPDGCHFILFDQIGRIVFEQSILPGTMQFEVPVLALPSGIYLGLLTSEAGTETAKIVVRH